MPRLRCPSCGRFVKLKMKSPIFDSTAHNAKETGWTYSGYCENCFKWVNLTERF